MLFQVNTSLSAAFVRALVVGHGFNIGSGLPSLVVGAGAEGVSVKEVKGNLWTFPADVLVITTNGTVKKNGEAVMGRGCALEAKTRWPNLPKMLGQHLVKHGNIPLRFPDSVSITGLWSFPVKHDWHQRADLDLIRQSAEYLAANCCAYADDWTDRDPVILLPRPGCGNGGLHWADVKKVLEPILDDRFHVITFEYFNHNEV